MDLNSKVENWNFVREINCQKVDRVLEVDQEVEMPPQRNELDHEADLEALQLKDLNDQTAVEVAVDLVAQIEAEAQNQKPVMTATRIEHPTRQMEIRNRKLKNLQKLFRRRKVNLETKVGIKGK